MRNKQKFSVFNRMFNMMIIGSTAHPEFNQMVSDRMGIPMAKCTLTKFSNGETKVVIDTDILGKTIYIVSTGCEPINDNLMETLMICDACKTADAKHVTLIMANYPYARQDKKNDLQKCLSASFVARMIEMSGVDKMITFDLHSRQIPSMFRIPVVNINTDRIFAEYLLKSNKSSSGVGSITDRTHIVVAPDAGAIERCQKLADYLGISMTCINKKRNYKNNDTIEQMTLMCQDTHGLDKKIVIVYDDIADTLGTLCKSCELLEKHGAIEVIAVVTHGILSGQAFENLEKCKVLKRLVCGNTLPITKSSTLSSKIEICDLTSLLTF
jgi:ribose-phosphate pyrophosphokinase